MLLTEVSNLPEKQWTPDINPVVATLTVVGQYKEQATPYHQYTQPVQLKDDAGVSAEVKVQTKFIDGLMTENMVGKKARWRLKWYAGRGGQAIVGYCLDKMPQAAPSQPQQAPSAAPAPPNASNAPQPRDYDAENRGKCRYGIVCAYISAGVDPDIATVDYWVEYSMTGKAPPPPGKGYAGENTNLGYAGDPAALPEWEH